jgi:ELWxxDGT repeat protein
MVLTRRRRPRAAAVCIAAILSILVSSATVSALGGPTFVKDIHVGTKGSDPLQLASLGNSLFLAATDSTHGKELWKSDGTHAGTTLVKDINPGTASSYPTWMTALDGFVVFAASRPGHPFELWRSDGTAAGTKHIKSVHLQPTGLRLARMGGLVYFGGNDGIHGNELWVTDGTTNGTHVVKDILPGSDGSEPDWLTVVGDTLYFTAKDHGQQDWELWRTDGADSGTTKVREIRPGNLGSRPYGLIGLGRTLYFAAEDGTHGYELWKSDGSTAGTRLVKDIDPGPTSSNPMPFESLAVAFDGHLYFTATNGITGYELWKSDGTAPGTRLLKETLPGPSDGLPVDYIKVGSTIFFTAQTPHKGRELWKVTR